MSPQSRGEDIDQLAAAPLDAEDDRVLAQIAALYRAIDPVPDGLLDRLQFGITLDAMHAEIADLQRSSELVGVRGEDAAQAQTVSITSPSATVMVTITAQTAEHVRIDGWVMPGGPVEIEVRMVGDTLREPADEDGRFVFADVPRGLAQFVVRRLDGSAPLVIAPLIQL